MSVKTITLTGAEVAVTGFKGSNAHIRNDGTEVIYAANSAGISAGADGVISIPAGQSNTLMGVLETFYMVGIGSAEVQTNDYPTSPFKSSVTGGVVTDMVASAVSNPNLLINPDFRINQRGKTEYNSYEYSADLWHGNNWSGTVTLGEGADVLLTTGASWCQTLEKLPAGAYTFTAKFANVLDSKNLFLKIPTNVSAKYIGGATGIQTITFTTDYDIANAEIGIYNGDTESHRFMVEWFKLEVGDTATLFSPPAPATELAKCQRYYQIRSSGDIDPVDLRPSMRATPAVTQLDDGNYAYSAEL